MTPTAEEQTVELGDLCRDLDDLTLRQIDCVEEQLILLKKLEAEMSSGFINLAKSRYIAGEKSVSMLQVPSDDSEVEAKLTVREDGENKWQLIKNENGTDAKKWFGVLVPSSLRQSQLSFQKALEIIIAILNARKDWLETMDEYKQKVTSKTT